MPQATFSISVDKATISQMPPVAFPGEITVVDTQAKVAAAIEQLLRHNVIGFDTETRPSFKKGASNKVALMQLSTDDHCYLFRLNCIDAAEPLRQIIENPDILKIGLSIHDDFNVMHRSESFEPRGFIDLQKFVSDYHIADISLQKIYAIIFGERISKGQRLTNWEAPALTPQQQAYAAIDAWACLRIYRYLTDGRFVPEESPYIVKPDEETPTADEEAS